MSGKCTAKYWFIVCGVIILEEDIRETLEYTVVAVVDECCFFFFQAEDGIRDVERSRGLGDVYKRQDYWGI